jgi:hypothetical protein
MTQTKWPWADEPKPNERPQLMILQLARDRVDENGKKGEKKNPGELDHPYEIYQLNVDSSS